MQSRGCHEPVGEEQYYIDKTEELEKGIVVFPSIYIEGAAATGKTTAVKMLLARYPEVEQKLVWMDREVRDIGAFLGYLDKIKSQLQEKATWIIFENIPADLPEEIQTAIVELIYSLPNDCRVILVGREKPGKRFLELMWKRKLELYSQRQLALTREEIGEWIEHEDSMLDPAYVFEETGGWAGCVYMMIHLAAKDIKETGARELREVYEINAYIQGVILASLTEREKKITHCVAMSPWVNAELCEQVWNIQDADTELEDLARKGFLDYSNKYHRWTVGRLFRRNLKDDSVETDDWKKLGEWYESKGNIRETLLCMKKLGNIYKDYVIKYYDQVPFLEIDYSEVMEWEDRRLELYYLRGMYCYSQQNIEGLEHEIQKVELTESNGRQKREIMLNLSYLNPKLSLDEWLEMLERNVINPERIHLYSIVGNSHTCLCGLRDISGLFACTRKEENRKARIWKEKLGEEAWIFYQLARVEYYLETERKEAIREEDWILMELEDSQESWRIRLVKLYLYCKLQRVEPRDDVIDHIIWLEESLLSEESTLCARNTEAICSLYSPWLEREDELVQWLKKSAGERLLGIGEENYAAFFCLAKGYLFLNQYDRAEKILQRIIPYLQLYQRTYLLSEALFQQAITSWGKNQHNKALRSAIEAFLAGGNNRYVGIYARYGKKGKEVLEEYLEWMRSNAPEGWRRKKKYNYGNVLRMPVEDYLNVILRCAKREARSGQLFSEEFVEEKLTMMETIILQDINRGMSNAEIGEELNLKITTVKSHIYSMYKKLGVNSRVQAILKGKEMGILN